LGGAEARSNSVPPVPDAARVGQDAQPRYGAFRPPAPVVPPKPVEFNWVTERMVADWKLRVGLFGDGESWGAKKPGTAASYAFRVDGASQTASWKLARVSDTFVTLTVSVQGRLPFDSQLPIKPELPAAKDEGAGSVEVDGQDVECAIKSYKVGEREVRVWWRKDAPGRWVKAVSGEETTRLIDERAEIRVMGRKYVCTVWQTVSPGFEATEWRSDQVPGGIVKRQEKSKGTVRTLELSSVAEPR
jgi:hypothetical protein